MIFWGPTRVLPVLGFRYYIVFVDDYSHVSWVYLLKDRFHVPEVIKKFFNEIKTRFSTSPKLFRTDNTLEFVQNNIVVFCCSLGILHQTLCPRTYKENGVIKRKHQHVLYVTRTIML